MRSACYSVLLLSLLAGCQQKPASTASAPTITSSAAPADTEPAAAAPVSVPTLSGEEQKFFAEYDLSSLIAKKPDDHEVMNGFYGADHYRIEFAMLEVRRDPDNPVHYFLKGKKRFKKAVTPFEGDILFTQLGSQPPAVAPEEYTKQGAKDYVLEMNKRSAYSTLGTFTLYEDSSYKGAGIFEGEVIMDFVVSDKGELELMTRNGYKNSKGGGILFKGTWTNPETKQQKPVLWVEYIFGFRQDIFKDFVIGERTSDFNPKYAKLGWDTWWQNEEWWAESGQIAATEAETASNSDGIAADSSAGI